MKVTVADTVESLRRRFFLCKELRNVADLSREIGLTRQTLARFARGGYVTVATLETIEAWIERHESARQETCT